MPGYAAAPAKPVGGFLTKGTLPSPRNFHVGGQCGIAAADFNNTVVGGSTELRIGELIVTAPCFTTGAALFNATTVGTDTTRICLYNSAGVIVASTAGVVTASANTYQRMAWALEFLTVPGTGTAVLAPVFLVPGTYYLAHIQSGITATVKTFVVGSFGAAMLVAAYVTAGITTSLNIAPPVTFTTLQGPAISLY